MNLDQLKLTFSSAGDEFDCGCRRSSHRNGHFPSGGSEDGAADRVPSGSRSRTGSGARRNERRVGSDGSDGCNSGYLLLAGIPEELRRRRTYRKNSDFPPFAGRVHFRFRGTGSETGRSI